MKTWTKAACLTLCAGLLVSGVAAGLRSDPKDDAKKKLEDAKKQLEELKKGAQPAGDDAAMWAAMLEMSKPVAQHEIIKSFAGTWKAEIKMWMDPTAKEPTVSSGAMKGTLVHGDRYLLGEFTGTFNNMPFSGSLTWGYNRIENRYESTWIDSWGTGLLMSTGQPTADGKTINSTGNFRMPGPDGKLMDITQRETITMVSKDKFTQQMWHGTKEGEMKVMEITYTRTGDAPKPVTAAPTVPAGLTMPPTTH